MKRILIFSTAYFPAIGGAEIAMKEITDRISPSDIEFHMITVNLSGHEAPIEKIGSVMVYRVGTGTVGKYLLPFLGTWKALQLHKKFHFDAIWSVMASYNSFAALFFKWCQPRIPFILTLQEGDPFEHIKRRVGIFYPFFVQIFRQADSIQTISVYLAEIARSLGAVAPIHVVPNGVDVELFSRNHSEFELDTLRQQLNKKQDDIFLITTSRLVPKNGIDTVIQALPLLPSHVVFLVAGVGPLETELKKIARNLHVADRVRFLGLVPHAELPRYLKVSDIFIRPSRSEGMGNSFIEAMAAEIPVVATPVGGIPEFVHDRETGMLCEVDSPASVAAAVTTLIEDRTVRDHIVTRAAAFVAGRYDWSFIASEMRQKAFGVV